MSLILIAGIWAGEGIQVVCASDLATDYDLARTAMAGSLPGQTKG
jgi:hypothetical protein